MKLKLVDNSWTMVVILSYQKYNKNVKVKQFLLNDSYQALTNCHLIKNMPQLYAVLLTTTKYFQYLTDDIYVMTEAVQQ